MEIQINEKNNTKQTKAFTRDEFSKVLFQCHNVIRNNDKLSPEAAFDEISKILFIKIRYERGSDNDEIFSTERFIEDKIFYDKHKSKEGLPFYQHLFQITKEEFENDVLFEKNEIFRIRENSFEEIVKKLQIYNLSKTSDDVKGIAFEQFLGRTFRGELGQFFTPRTVVDFMIDILEPKEGEIMCDPCCGSGGFLIKAFEYVRDNIETDILKQKEKFKTYYFDDNFEKLSAKKQQVIKEQVNTYSNNLDKELNKDNKQSRLHNLSHNCIFGTDANPRMSRTAKMNMIMHGDGHGGIHNNDGLLNVNGIFENCFDVILTNPPFGANVSKDLKVHQDDGYVGIEITPTDDEKSNNIDLRKIRNQHPKRKDHIEKYGNDLAFQQVDNNIGKPILSLYNTGKHSSLTEVLFIERCLNLLKAGGRMGIVLPEGVLNNPKLQKIRDYVESKAKIVLITSIPQDVFIASGATVKPSLLFFKKFTDEEAKQWQALANKAKKEITAQYADKITVIDTELKKKGKEAVSTDEKKVLRKTKKELETKRDTEIQAYIKEHFDYQIPIAEVEKAGIGTTGEVIENELEPLAKEFKSYRLKNDLWQDNASEFSYEIIDNELLRTELSASDDKKAVKFYE